MEKLDPKKDGATTNIVEKNIERMKEFFPEVFTEGKIDLDALRETLGDYADKRQERYSFTWNGKARARRIAQTPSTGTLRPCPEESVNWDTTRNLFIEGDNLEVLKLLQKSYHKKIKMIYIDPPYNTGGEFIYPDKYQDNLQTYLKYTGQIDEEGLKLSANTESSGRYHTNWLNMMLPRLKLARNLLREDGVIAISIDDHELHNLRQLCDEFFGTENFVGCITRATGTTTGQDAGKIGSSLDYILVYQRSPEFSLSGIPMSEDDEKRFAEEDEIGKYSVLQLRKTGNADRREDRPSMYYPVIAPNGNEIFPVGPSGYESRWRFGPDTFREYKSKGLIVWKKNRLGQLAPYVKYYLEGRTKQVSNLWNDLDGNKKGTIEVRNLLEVKVFDNPKPTEMLKRIIQIASVKDDEYILDFFSGSCSTAHAMLALNKEDYTNRRFIMVQLPEPCDRKSIAFKAGFKTIAEIGKERIRRVINQLEEELIRNTTGEQDSLLKEVADMPDLDLGFKVFKLEASNIKPWDADFDNLETALFDAVENIKPDRSEADVLYELLLKYGLDLAVPIEEREIGGKTVYVIGAGALVVCLGKQISLEVVEGIAALKKKLKPEVMRVVFRDSGFADDVVKTNAIQILHQAEIEDVKSL